ncbi:MAG: hypothetical protein ABFS24_15020, partial [Pseudomonadota bacterium]
MTSITSATTLRTLLPKRNLSWRSLAFSFLLLTHLTGPTAAVPLPTFPDPNFQACFDEQTAAQGWVNAEDVRELVCVKHGIRDLFGVEQLPLLESLNASDNRIFDIIPLGAAPLSDTLRELRLANNAITDINALTSYRNLATLW